MATSSTKISSKASSKAETECPSDKDTNPVDRVVCISCLCNEFKGLRRFPDIFGNDVKIVDCHGACKLHGSPPPEPFTSWIDPCEGCIDRYLTIRRDSINPTVKRDSIDFNNRIDYSILVAL